MDLSNVSGGELRRRAAVIAAEHERRRLEQERMRRERERVPHAEAVRISEMYRKRYYG